MTDAGPADRWFAHATTHWSDNSAEDLLALKGSHRVSVIVPARDEAATIVDIVTAVRRDLQERVALVDEIVVIDSDSCDDTARLAARAGAVVHRSADVRPDLGTHPGKGEALWKAQFVSGGDILVFLDADLTEWGTHFVSALLGPLFARPEVILVKGFYDRVLDSVDGPSHGGRVTELVARPLLSLWWPELAQVVQPLAGEWAVRRSEFDQLSVPIGYGVEVAALLDVYRRHGLDSIAQVDLGERGHSHQSIHDLGVMAAEILTVAMRRLDYASGDTADVLWQFDRAQTPPWQGRPVPAVERPPARDVSPSLRI